MSGSSVTDAVREKYTRAASHAALGSQPACCGGGCGADAPDPITPHLYGSSELHGLPEQAIIASLGCGNPSALAELSPGEVVLDLGSGGGLDVLLSARRVGPTGRAYGLDMTDEMLALAGENRCRAGIENAEFLQGTIESIPLPDRSVDVVISNCVINLSLDKRRVLAEAFRVLRPGGRLAVSDIVVQGALPPPLRRSLELWAGCIAGALEVSELEALLIGQGFEGVTLEPTRVYRYQDALAVLGPSEAGAEGYAREIDGRLMAAFVRARKPA